LSETQADNPRLRFKPVSVDGLSLQPAHGAAEVELDAPDPLVFHVTAFVELPDGTLKTFTFQSYYAGEYDSGQGVNTRRDGTPVRLLSRPVRRPKVPEPPAGIDIDRDKTNVFGVLGLGSERMGIRQALATLPNGRFDIGYCTGFDAYGYALGDFPYDYERLFQFRALVFANAQLQEIRSIGGSILLPWLKAGGGLVFGGGEHAFNFEFREHEINRRLPIAPKRGNLTLGARQLQPPLVPDHPIFRGVELNDLPWLLYCHDIELKPDSNARVLMTVGEYPFIVEQQTGNQRTLAVACNHFGTAEDLGGKTHLRNWAEWPRLFSNVVRYAAGELK